MSGQIAGGPEAAAPAGSPGLAASTPGVATTKPISELNGTRAGAAGPRPSSISGSSQWAGQVANSGTAKTFGESGGGQAEIKEREPLVVQVVLSPEAFEKNSFERLLARNGIEIDTDAKKQADSLDLGASRFKVSREKQPAAAPMPAKKAEAKQRELLLVDAPAIAIDACLKSLHDDTANYVSVGIGTAQPSKDQLQDKSKVHSSKLDTFDRYARGPANPRANDGLNMRRDFNNYNKQVSTPQLGEEASKSESLVEHDRTISAGATASPERKRETTVNLGRVVRLPAEVKLYDTNGDKSGLGSNLEAGDVATRNTTDEPYGLRPQDSQKSEPGKLRV
jgi:hypothetical protein